MFVSKYVEINLGNNFIFKSDHLRLNVKRQSLRTPKPRLCNLHLERGAKILRSLFIFKLD